MSEKNITRVSADEIGRRRGSTRLERLRRMDDETLERLIAEAGEEAPEEFDWTRAVVVERPRKRSVSIRLDEDVLAFFKAHGPGYQTRINAVLRAYMKSAPSRNTDRGRVPRENDLPTVRDRRHPTKG